MLYYYTKNEWAAESLRLSEMHDESMKRSEKYG